MWAACPSSTWQHCPTERLVCRSDREQSATRHPWFQGLTSCQRSNWVCKRTAWLIAPVKQARRTLRRGNQDCGLIRDQRKVCAGPLQHCKEPRLEVPPEATPDATTAKTAKPRIENPDGAFELSKQGWTESARRRQLLLAIGVSIFSAAKSTVSLAGESPIKSNTKETSESLLLAQRNLEKVKQAIGGPSLLVDYTREGPYDIRTLPTILEHTCANCYPQCVDGSCLLRIKVTYPGNGRVGHEPYPLAIFTSGFLVSSDQYQSYANRLASWGYVVLTYNKAEGLTGPLDDVLSARFISELISWAEQSRILKSRIDTKRVYLCGHSRGGKISVLAAAQDKRVAALCLLDPVDNTVYAPLAPGYPSAVAALRVGRDGVESIRGPNGPRTVQVNGRYLAASLPIAIVGGALGGDCAPLDANYRRFYNASSPPSWEVVIREAGHFQFVDNASTLQDTVCGAGKVDSRAVNAISKAVMVTWAELMIRGKRAPIRGESLLEGTCQPGQEAEPPLETRPARKPKKRDQSRVARASTVDEASADARTSPSDGQKQPLEEPSHSQNKAVDDLKVLAGAGKEESQVSSPSQNKGLKEQDGRGSPSCNVSTSEETLRAASEKVSSGDLSIPKRAVAGAVSPGSPFGETAQAPEPGGNNRSKSAQDTEPGGSNWGEGKTAIGEWPADHRGEEAALVGSRIWSVAEAVEAVTQELRRRTTLSSQLRL